jgi:hypothetical protein
MASIFVESSIESDAELLNRKIPALFSAGKSAIDTFRISNAACNAITAPCHNSSIIKALCNVKSAGPNEAGRAICAP